jgi:hypothetical protein
MARQAACSGHARRSLGNRCNFWNESDLPIEDKAVSPWRYPVRKSNDRGGGDIQLEHPGFAGRWAGDEVYLVGDYDESHLYETARTKYRNISRELAAEYNLFVEVDTHKLRIK